jgi:hypothetical protein
VSKLAVGPGETVLVRISTLVVRGGAVRAFTSIEFSDPDASEEVHCELVAEGIAKPTAMLVVLPSKIDVGIVMADQEVRSAVVVQATFTPRGPPPELALSVLRGSNVCQLEQCGTPEIEEHAQSTLVRVPVHLLFRSPSITGEFEERICVGVAECQDRPSGLISICGLVK